MNYNNSECVKWVIAQQKQNNVYIQHQAAHHCGHLHSTRHTSNYHHRTRPKTTIRSKICATQELHGCHIAPLRTSTIHISRQQIFEAHLIVGHALVPVRNEITNTVPRLQPGPQRKKPLTFLPPVDKNIYWYFVSFVYR